jgi:hypothetical protein
MHVCSYFMQNTLGQKDLKGLILFKKLGWTVLYLPTVCEVLKKSPAFGSFKEKPDKGRFYDFDVRFYLSLLKTQ